MQLRPSRNTNSDPEQVDYVIPGNDDALRSIRLFTSRIADAVVAGRTMRESARAEADDQAGRRSAVRPRTDVAAAAPPAAPPASA